MAENELLDSKGRFLRRWRELCSSEPSADEAAAAIADEWGAWVLKSLNRDRRHRAVKQLLDAAQESDAALRAASVGMKPPDLVRIICQAIRACAEPRTPDRVAVQAVFMSMDRVTQCLVAQVHQESAAGTDRSDEFRDSLEKHFERHRAAVELQFRQALSGDWAGSPLRKQPPGTPMEVRAKAVLEIPLVTRLGGRRVH